MKTNLLNFGKWALALALATSVVSCDKAEPEPAPQPADDAIAITNVTPSYNSVTFDVDAKDALAVAYIALPKGETTTAEDIFENGDAKGSAQGTFTYKGLESETEYTLYVASKSATSGNKGPVAVDFSTLENQGEPATELAAGIRLEKVSSDNIVFEVTNGSEVDFSLVMVKPTVIMDNYAFEASKAGLSKVDAITGFMLEEGNGFLSKQTTGAGAKATYNYADICAVAVDLYPGANYTIYSLGCTGTFDDPASIAAGDLTMVDVTTDAIARTGDPQVKVECVEAGYIMFKHKITPNASCKYWAKYFSKTEEFVEFRNHYDELEGEGAGDKRLLEYIMHSDPYVTGQSDEAVVSLSLGFDMAGIKFSRLALAFDKNRVPSDRYEENIQELIEVDETIEKGKYDLNVENVGAGDMYIDAKLYENCARVYWRMVPAGALDSELNDYDAGVNLGRALWDAGWAEPSGMDKKEGDVMDVNYLHYGEPADTEMDLIATSLNYDGGIDFPRKVATFKTLAYTRGDYEPAITLDLSNIGKTNINIKYIADPDCIANDDRMLFHRMYAANNEVLTENPTIDDMYEYLTANGSYESDMWTIVSNDSADVNPYEYTFNWSGLEADSEYVYYYMTLNGKGEFSELKEVRFSTLSNEGGANPYITLEVKPEDVKISEENSSVYGAKGSITPNFDVTAYKYIFIDENTLESWIGDDYTTEEMQLQMYTQLVAEGLPSVNPTTLENYYRTLTKDKLYLMAQGQGAAGVESPLSYIEIHSDGTVLDQVDVDLSKFSSPAKSSSNIKSAPYTERRTGFHKPMPKFDSEFIVKSSKTYQYNQSSKREQKRELDGPALRAAGIPYYSFKEMSRRTLRCGVEE